MSGDEQRGAVTAGAGADGDGPVGAAPAAGPEHRLVVYGTLRPGRENHALVADLGAWQPATMTGWMRSWGRYPAFVPDPAGDEIDADLVTSAHLPARWPELDAFEGPGYRRIVLGVETAGGRVEASCYVLADD